MSALELRPGPRKSEFIELSGIDRGLLSATGGKRLVFLSRAAVTDDHKMVRLKQQKSFLSRLEAGSPKSRRQRD